MADNWFEKLKRDPDIRAVLLEQQIFRKLGQLWDHGVGCRCVECNEIFGQVKKS